MFPYLRFAAELAVILSELRLVVLVFVATVVVAVALSFFFSSMSTVFS